MYVHCCTKHEGKMTRYGAHCHTTFEIILNLSGHCTTRADGKEYYMKKSDILIIPPGVMHEAHSDVFFTDFFIQASPLPFDSVYHTKDNSGIILSLMNLLHQVMLEKEIHYKSIAANLLATIDSYLEKYINVNYKYGFISTLKNEIMEGFSDPAFSLSETMEKYRYNKDYLRRCFEKDVGKTPQEYLTFLRINKAKMLLIQSNFQSVRDVSEKCGYADSLYFSTLFKKKTGVSPLQYRKRQSF